MRKMHPRAPGRSGVGCPPCPQSARGTLATLGAEPLPNRGILHPPGVWRLPTKSSFIQRRGRGAGGAADPRDRTIALNLRPGLARMLPIYTA